MFNSHCKRFTHSEIRLIGHRVDYDGSTNTYRIRKYVLEYNQWRVNILCRKIKRKKICIHTCISYITTHNRKKVSGYACRYIEKEKCLKYTIFERKHLLLTHNVRKNKRNRISYLRVNRINILRIGVTYTWYANALNIQPQVYAWCVMILLFLFHRPGTAKNMCTKLSNPT